VDELVNMELYRREFEFGVPRMGGESGEGSGEGSGEEERLGGDYEGRNEIINGIEI